MLAAALPVISILLVPPSESVLPKVSVPTLLSPGVRLLPEVTVTAVPMVPVPLSVPPVPEKLTGWVSAVELL